MSNSNSKNILLIGGHDPSGAAGIQADIEATLATGCRPLSVVTALTAQNTRTMAGVYPQTAENFNKQLELILDDVNIHACKLGLIANTEFVPFIVDKLSALNIPIVLDPVLKSGTGTALADENMLDTIRQQLCPISTIITPNSEEVRQLAQCDELEQAAKNLFNFGVDSVLITGTHEPAEDVINTLFFASGEKSEYRYTRLPHTYHGSGCTLAASIAANMAIDNDLNTAVKKAQDFTWNALKHATQIGLGQWHPDRFYHDE